MVSVSDLTPDKTGVQQYVTVNWLDICRSYYFDGNSVP